MENKLINAAEVRLMCGGISDMCLWRWLNTPSLHFPRPAVIQRRRYFREAEVKDWIARQVEWC